MSGYILTSASQIQCLHSGQAVLLTTNTSALPDSAPALLETDVHLVVGCPFTVGFKYSPCVRIQWSGGAARVTVHGTRVLDQACVGKCYSAEGVVQGLAIVVSTQSKGRTG